MVREDEVTRCEINLEEEIERATKYLGLIEEQTFGSIDSTHLMREIIIMKINIQPNPRKLAGNHKSTLRQ